MDWSRHTVSKSCLIVVDIRIFFCPLISFVFLSPCLNCECQEQGLNRIGGGGVKGRMVE